MLEQIFEDSPLAMLLTSDDLKITQVNPRAVSYFGDLQLVGKNLRDLIWPEDREIFSHILDDPVSTAFQIGRLKHYSGHKLYSCLQVSANKGTQCWYIVEQDEVQGLRAELDTYKSLPKEYGHNINNLLTVIISACELAIMDLNGEPSIKEDLNDILTASYRAASQTRLFMNLGRKLVINQMLFSFNDIIDEILPLLTDILGSKASLEFCKSDEKNLIYITKISMQGAIAQMCAHARMIKPCGDFILSIDTVEITTPFSTYGIGVPEGEYVVATLRQRNFPFETYILNTDSFHVPDEAEALSLCWEGAVRAKGSIAQRIDKDDNICISIYIPSITEIQ
jgi:PAS domain S-box-containing protein